MFINGTFAIFFQSMHKCFGLFSYIFIAVHITENTNKNLVSVDTDIN